MAKPAGDSTTRDIRAIRESLVSIIETLVGALERLGEPAPAARARRARLSADRWAALRLQGRYMGLLRALKPRQQAQVKALRAAKGVQRAINLAAKLAKR